MQPTIFSDESQDLQKTVDNPVYADEGIVTKQDPLALDIPDDELVKIIDNTIEESKKFWNSKYNLSERRKKLERTLFGREIEEKERNNEIKKYETRYSNNATYEIEATLKPVAMSKLPDMIVAPGSESPESQESSEELSKIVNDDLKKRENRKVLGLGFKHLPVYLTAVIKARWNPEIGDHGDYEFINVHPDRIVLDKTAISNDASKMRVIAEAVPLTVQDVVMRFPNKKEDFFKKLKGKGLAVGETDFTWKDLASEIQIWEVHFTWYKKSQTPPAEGSSLEEPGVKWERIEGVLWKYDDVVFKKMRTPNFDYQGEERWFSYDDPADDNSKRDLTEDELMMGMATGAMPQAIGNEQVYFNYFKAPQKPYFFFGYDQWGKVAIDETSRIEQNLHNQENLNGMGKQIMDTLKARVKHIWSTDSSLTAEDVQNLDMENPKLDALVDGNVNDVHKSIEPERPDAAQFNALNMAKQDMFSLAGATALTGTVQSDVATTNQIAREQNFTRADDLVEDTINAAAEWMSQWAMQFIKLRYTDDHFRKLLGTKGQFTFLKIKRDKVEDGMEVMIKASSTDKLKAQRNAMDAAKLGAPYTNPLDFFKDMEYSDPEGRTERGVTFAVDPNTYMVKYVMGLQSTEQQVAALSGQASPPPPGGPSAAPATPPPAVPPPTGTPMNASPQNTSAVPTEQPAFPEGSPRGL